MDDNSAALLLSAALTLVNTSSEAFPSNVPRDLADCFRALLKQIWHKLMSGKPMEKGHAPSMDSDIAEAVFRLSLDRAQHLSSSATEIIRRNIFGDADSDLWRFFLNHWERSPFLFEGSPMNLKEHSIDFNSLFPSSDKRTSGVVLDSVLQGMVSCPPIASDELDIISFLREARSSLGSSPLYGQDIRIVKTLRTASWDCEEFETKEVHYFDTMLHRVNNIQKCKEAFHDGYTMALRGLGFRLEKASAITDGLAEIFGLPSVGANVYLTPPGSQGLSRHFDDHCVFVCQLLGTKEWKLSHCQGSILPRLYEGQCSNCGENIEDIHVTLREGNILYIPRGCFHEAYTTTNYNRSSEEEAEDFSLHLTLAVEVEPPFEWEGFVHVALHCWNEKLRQDELCRSSGAFINMLHVAIRILAGRDHTFRKACLVAARFPPGLVEQHALCQKAIFVELINKVRASCRFLDAFASVEAAVGFNHESLQWLRWLRHLKDGEADFSNPVEYFKDVVGLIKVDLEGAEAASEIVKNKFCMEVVFEDTCDSFVALVERYRRTRRQYMNGMLLLHPNS